MPPCGQCNSGTAETASVLYLTHPVLSSPFLRFLKNFPVGACGAYRLLMHSGRWPVRAGGVLTEALLRISAGCPSGGPFLVPPRKGERMRLKEALKGLLPQTKPPSLRILPARTWYREAGFRRFLRKHPRIQHIPCQCAHWRGIEDQFGLWDDCQWQSSPCGFLKNCPAAPVGSD